ncbi:MAG: cellulose biosynthesis protein CelD [Pseudomonadales bacterium]|nr:cellulose biosynthesis protein CelD [Pseudomonadales bacterium]
MHEYHGYRVQMSQPEPAALASPWQALEARAEPNFFLSWCWVVAWLAVFKPRFRLVELYYQDQLVGLGLLTGATETRHRLIRSRVLRLGQTGDPLQDQIWIEYNGLLLHKDHAETAPRAFMAALMVATDWDEFQLGASTQSTLARYRHPDCTPVLRWQAPDYGVDLAALRRTGASYRQTLSRNTRHQIQRTERLYREAGSLEFSVLQTADAMLALWEELGAMHQDRWGTEPGTSGFVNPWFVNFHRQLIRQGAGQGLVEFCTLRVAGELIGILYNFIYRGKVYFYLSGLRYPSDQRLKPGMLLHCLAIEHYLERGLDDYDFLGGEARYKGSLGQRREPLQLVSLQRPRLTLRLEQLGRRLKHWKFRTKPAGI